MKKTLLGTICTLSLISALHGMETTIIVDVAPPIRANSPFLDLDLAHAQALVEGVQQYTAIMDKLQKESPEIENNAAFKAYKTMCSIMHLNLVDGTLSRFALKRVQDLREYTGVLPALKDIYTYYHENKNYQDLLKKAQAVATEYPEEAKKLLTTLMQKGCLNISIRIKDTSSFICPKVHFEDPKEQCTYILSLNEKQAKEKDIHVYIAGVYALFLCVQEKDALLALIKQHVQ
jgi:hypothetical protein